VSNPYLPSLPVLLCQAGGNWNQVIAILASVYFLGVPCWLLMDPRTAIDAGADVSRPAVASQSV
jgi:hypothetical protein